MIYIFGNWKCNPTTQKKAKSIFREIDRNFSKNSKIKVAIFPPFVFLNSLNSINVKKGAQDVFWEKQGAFTGEVSPLMVKDAECEYCLVGHSERRYIIGENEKVVQKKFEACVKNKIVPVLCFGERKKGSFSQVKKEIRRQLQFIIGKKIKANFILAYEPVFSIGTGYACDVRHINEVLIFVKNELNIRNAILYGGSVNSRNCEEIIQDSNINGFLIGGASLMPREFLKISEKVEKYASKDKK